MQIERNLKIVLHQGNTQFSLVIKRLCLSSLLGREMKSCFSGINRNFTVANYPQLAMVVVFKTKEKCACFLGYSYLIPLVLITLDAKWQSEIYKDSQILKLSHSE